MNRVSKEIVHSDPDADGRGDRESNVGSTDAVRKLNTPTDRDADPQRKGTVDRDGETISATELVFGMGSAPDGVDPRIEPDERDSLEAADVDPDAVESKECSYQMLLDAGVDEPIADALRRRFSLPWSFEGDGDLERRSSEVRGLGAAEREWIAVSGDEDWQAFEYEHATESSIGRQRPSERPWPKPTPVTAVAGVGPDDADELAEAGVRSAERLATISAFEVARVLELNVIHVRTWRHNARELVG